MDLTLTPDQQLVQSTARDFLSARAGADGLWKEIVELGWTGLAFPETYGGVGEGFLELCLVIEEFGRARVASPFAATVACCGMPILAHGTEAQRAEWLAAIADGRVLTHADGVVVKGGVVVNGGALHGTAMYVPHADAADALLVAAQDGDRAITVLIDAAAPGVSHERLDVIGDPSFRVRFDAVAIAGDRVLDGAAEAITAYGTAALCAEMVGGAQAVLDMTVGFAAQREQFGTPIGTFQAVQHHCANMAIDVLGARLSAYEAIWRLASGHDATLELSLAKSWVSDAYERVCALAHQVHGAIGFTGEHDLHRYTRHATATALAFGDADEHTERVAGAIGL